MIIAPLIPSIVPKTLALPAALLHSSLSNLETVCCEDELTTVCCMHVGDRCGYRKLMATMNVMAGIRLVMADTNVAEVITRLCRYRFCPRDPLHFTNFYIDQISFQLSHIASVYDQEFESTCYCCNYHGSRIYLIKLINLIKVF